MTILCFDTSCRYDARLTIDTADEFIKRRGFGKASRPDAIDAAEAAALAAERYGDLPPWAGGPPDVLVATDDEPRDALPLELKETGDSHDTASNFGGAAIGYLYEGKEESKMELDVLHMQSQTDETVSDRSTDLAQAGPSDVVVPADGRLRKIIE
eukprot:SAG31_NODE_13903_length_838_cov_1.557510_2_plen_154_part_01